MTPHAECWVRDNLHSQTLDPVQRKYKYVIWYIEWVTPHAECWVRDDLHSQTIDSVQLEYKYVIWHLEWVTPHVECWVRDNLHSQNARDVMSVDLVYSRRKTGIEREYSYLLCKNGATNE